MSEEVCPNFQLVYRVVCALCSWFGVIGQLVNAALNGPAEWSLVGRLVSIASYFTIQTNLLVALWFTVAVMDWKRESSHPVLQSKVKGALTVYITVTGVIYTLLLRNIWEPQGITLVLTTINHDIVPIVFVIDWLLYEKRRSYDWRYVFLWLIYPLVYLVYAQIYGGVTGRYLYPFLDLSLVSWGGLVLNVIGLCACFVVLSSLYIGINRNWRSERIRE